MWQRLQIRLLALAINCLETFKQPRIIGEDALDLIVDGVTLRLLLCCQSEISYRSYSS